MKVNLLHIMSAGVTLLMSVQAHAYTTPASYEYWFDNDRNTLVRGQSGADGFEVSADVSGLSSGIHEVYYRMLNAEGIPGSPGMARFFKTGEISWESFNSSRTPVAYEYWFDNDRSTLGSGQCVTDGIDASIDVSGLSAGVHHLYYRMKNAEGKFGLPGVSRFFKPGVITWESDNSSRTHVAYRTLLNGKEMGITPIDPSTTEFEFELPVGDDVDIKDVGGRDFQIRGNSVVANLYGNFDLGIQLLSSSNEWGAPLTYRFEKSKQVVKNPVVMEPASSVVISKPNELDFVAYKIEDTGYPMYLTANQRCEVAVYYSINSNFTDFWGGYRYQGELKEGLEISGSEYGYIVLVYDTPVDKENPEGEIELTLSYNKGVTPAPKVEFDYSTNLLTMASPEPGAFIYYTLDGSKPAHESSVYTSPIKVEHNMTVRAIAWTETYGDSRETMIVIDPFTLPEPQLERVGTGYIFTCSVDDVNIYYTLDGTDPVLSPTRILFDGNPFEINEVCTVLAYATKEYFNDSYVMQRDITPKCADPVVANYDGHYVTLSCPEPRASIYYNDPETWEVTKYTGEKIELLGVYTVFDFYATIDDSGFEQSNTQVFIPDYYSYWNNDGGQFHVDVKKPGMLSKAFDWIEGANFEKLRVWGYNHYSNEQVLNDADFDYLRNLKGVKHLDIADIDYSKLPDNALAGSEVYSVLLPGSLIEFGKTPFKGCNNLAYVEVRAEIPIPADLFDGATLSPNMILYTPVASNAKDVKSVVPNIISEDEAATVKFTDGYPYYSPRDFFVKEVTYRKDFSKKTPIGGTGGWEAISLPFTVSSVSHEKGLLYPFGVWGETDLNYWLYNYNQNVWLRDNNISQLSAYLIAMPNNENYYEEYCITGTVTFKGEMVYVQNSERLNDEYFQYRYSRFKSNYGVMEASNDVMVLNDETYLADGKSYEPGSVFVAGLRAPRPFEAYMINYSNTRYMSLASLSGVDEVFANMGFRVWTEGRDVCISSDISSRVRIFDTVGRLMAEVNVAGGDTARVSNLAPGIYIVGNQKIMIK